MSGVKIPKLPKYRHGQNLMQNPNILNSGKDIIFCRRKKTNAQNHSRNYGLKNSTNGTLKLMNNFFKITYILLFHLYYSC